MKKAMPVDGHGFLSFGDVCYELETYLTFTAEKS